LARQRPSFLKRQKEMQRHAKAAAKRARREAKRNEDSADLDSMMARVNEFGDIIDDVEEDTPPQDNEPEQERASGA